MKVRVIDRKEYLNERAIATVVNETELARRKVLTIRFESGCELDVESSEVEVVPNGL